MFEKALNALTPEQRDIIVLSRFQQLKYEDIAEMMNVNLNTFKARMRSAINLLQRTYQELSGEASE